MSAETFSQKFVKDTDEMPQAASLKPKLQYNGLKYLLA